MPRIYALLLLFLLAIPAFGQSVVPPDVNRVISGGCWEENGQAGFYRVIITNSGYEHVTSRVLIQWVADLFSPNEEPSVISSVEPSLSFGQGVASLEARLNPIHAGQVQVLLSGVISYEPFENVRATLTVKGPGAITVDRH